MMNLSFTAKWSIANAVGLCVGFFAVLQTGFLLQFGSDFDAHWSPAGLGLGVWLGYRFLGLLLGGALFGTAQALVLMSKLPRIVPWILAGAIGYGLIAAIIWPFWASGLWGKIPGPVEPLLITIGGGLIMGLSQWWFLRINAIQATSWLRWWFAGLFLSLPITFLVFFVVAGIFGLRFSWPFEVGLSGFIIGGVAGLVSAKATRNLFSPSPAHV
jgi:hypothetical protein